MQKNFYWVIFKRCRRILTGWFWTGAEEYWLGDYELMQKNFDWVILTRCKRIWLGDFELVQKNFDGDFEPVQKNFDWMVRPKVPLYSWWHVKIPKITNSLPATVFFLHSDGPAITGALILYYLLDGLRQLNTANRPEKGRQTRLHVRANPTS